MSHGKLREDTTCQNCGDDVTVRFCPSCGQENTETKKSFHYLFTHFLEDLVHYESSFWKTLKYLLLSPEKLSLTYLSGKRKAFMAPVRLFIFVNIVSFVIFSTFTFKEIENEFNNGVIEEKQINDKHTKKENKDTYSKANFNFNSNSSSINNKLKRLDEKYTPEEIFHKVFQNLPKWLFLIMPFFALTLWLTHNKKKWWYFHNGIFTFHYFASFLFITSLTTIVNQLINLFGYETNEYFTIIIFILLNFIFIKAFLKFYNESWRKSLIKLFAIYFLNSLIILITFILFVFYIYTIL